MMKKKGGLERKGRRGERLKGMEERRREMQQMSTLTSTWQSRALMAMSPRLGKGRRGSELEHRLEKTVCSCLVGTSGV